MANILIKLSDNEVEENRTIYHDMVGKKVTCVVTGLIVKGNVVAFLENEYGFELDIIHEPVMWGDQVFTRTFFWARKLDNWGSLNHVKTI